MPYTLVQSVTVPQSTENSYPPSSPTSKSHHLDPFGHNYTLTGLVNSIESSLSELISSKQSQQKSQDINHSSQLDTLVHIQSQVTVLRNIIVYNLNQILDAIYPDSKQKIDNTKDQTKTQTNNEKMIDPFNESLPINEFDNSCHDQKYKEIQHLEAHHDVLSLKNSGYEKENSTGAEGEKSRVNQDKVRALVKEITPFSLQDMENLPMIRVEDGDDSQEATFEEDGLDLICYEQEQISLKGRKTRRILPPQPKNFSPIAQQAPEDEQTAQKQTMAFKSQTHFKTAGDLNRKLFSYMGIVLPKRMSRKKFNYLEQIF